MQQINDTPTFNMKVVVQETGLKPDTLRAWERRYNLPQPDRTEGGHRLYSQRDIETLKWLIDRQEEGLSISHAVDLWNRLLSEGNDPLLEQVKQQTSPLPDIPQQIITSGTTMAQLRETWIEACMAFDEHTAEAALTQAFALYSPENVCYELLQKGLSNIGDGWYQGETTVQQEHFASALALRRLEALVSAAPRPTRSERILVGCPPHEEHTFVPLLLTLLLRRRGWDVIYLGANVPIDRLETTIKTTRPEIAVFPAQQLHTAASLPEIANLLEDQGISLAFGGRIFIELPELKKRINGHYLGDSTETAVQVIERAVFNGGTPGNLLEISERYQKSLTLFERQRSLIELTTWQIVKDKEIPYAHVVNANLHLARNIVAALKLGDMKFLGSEISWVQGLMDNYGIDTNYLPVYLDAYFKAARQHLEGEASPVVDWLSQFHTS